MWKGVTIRRIWNPGLGKKSKWRRLADFACFWGSALITLLRLPRFDLTVCLTSPPLISTLGTLVAWMKGGEVVPWVMDLNPDEAVAAGWLRGGGLVERTLSRLQKWSFGRSAKIMALDRFMAARIEAKGIPAGLIHVDAPWSYEESVFFDSEGREAFRREHGLNGKFVVMYSGNHSPCHPLDTVLMAAEKLAKDPAIVFMFVGGGSEFPKVKAFAAGRGLPNIKCLPYQPLEKLSASLSAADLHLVVMGDPFAGIVHPCKVYNILLLGMPFLGICPAECHLADLAEKVADRKYATCVRHGDVEAAMRHLEQAAAEPFAGSSPEVRALGLKFVNRILRPRFVRILESAVLRREVAA
jgi:hypothetical protein